MQSLRTYLFCVGLLIGCARAAPMPEAYALPRHLQEGFLTWESNRTGAWRILTRPLAGGEPRQLSPDEDGRDHLAAHISPDGTKVVYLSFPKGLHGYRKHGPDVVIPLYVLDLTTDAPPRKIMENARPYGEHRCAIWLNNQELITIDERYITHRLDLDTSTLQGIVKDRPRGRSWDHAYLLDPTLKTAFSGRPGFFHYNADTQRVSPREVMPGCQPNVTRDGTWGYWMLGMGGPLNRYHIASGQTGVIVDKHDPRMPEDRGYIYFPHISPCRQLLVFAASPDAHDHHTSDYDLFVAPLNPSTLELSADPIRFTFDPATDRFPEVFVQPLVLGIQNGEAPFQPEVTVSSDSETSWTVNGAPHKGPPFTFTQPGSYLLEALQNSNRLRGLVVVSPAAPPSLVSAALTREGEVALSFDEPVNLGHLDMDFPSGTTLGSVLHTSGSSFVRIRTDPPATEAITLTLRGIRDTAQYPNLMPPQSLTLAPATWPVDPDGLLLVWETGRGQREFIPPSADTPRTLNLTPRNRARFSAYQAMRLDGGAFLAEEANESLLEALRNTHELTIEAIVHPRQDHQTGPARIITFSSGTTSRNFTLGQEGTQLVFRLRTDNTGANAHQKQIEIGPLDSQAPTHVTLTYRPGELIAYFDGKPIHRSTLHQGGFTSWEKQTLLFGEETDGRRGWSGTLEGVAIYSRALSAEEVSANAGQAADRLAARFPVPTSIVEARLIAATPIPPLEQIDPYRSIMVVNEYETLRTLQGPELPERFRVHHWGLLDGYQQDLPVSTPGQSARLVLQPLAAHSHLEAIFPADSLDPDFDVPVYLDVAP